MMIPTIGIACRESYDQEYDLQVHGVGVPYIESVCQAGGKPLLVPLIDGARDLVAEYAEMCDGFVFAGGEDIEPARYDVRAHATVSGVSPSRDTVEFDLFRAAYEMRKPMLGVCRGLQIFNVALGGTLVQDIPSERAIPGLHRKDPELWAEIVHDVVVEHGTLLSSVIGSGAKPVNSLHHQCIDRLGEGLVVSARHPEDGVIEAVELCEGEQWLLGVQWHPEVLWQDSRRGGTGLDWNLDLFRALVRACLART